MGASRQRRPFLITKVIPLSTRRPSTLGTPCDNEKYGSIRRICASDNQNKLFMTTPTSAPPLDQIAAPLGNPLIGSEPNAPTTGNTNYGYLDMILEF